MRSQVGLYFKSGGISCRRHLVEFRQAWIEVIPDIKTRHWEQGRSDQSRKGNSSTLAAFD
jgi:hypothetical protein